MGDRASIIFETDGDRSAVLCSHWGGEEFQNHAISWAMNLCDTINKADKDAISTPLSRLEPQYVIVKFIRDCGGAFNVYLGKDRTEVDDSDNGCVVIKFTNQGIETEREE